MVSKPVDALHSYPPLRLHTDTNLQNPVVVQQLDLFGTGLCEAPILHYACMPEQLQRHRHALLYQQRHNSLETPK